MSGHLPRRVGDGRADADGRADLFGRFSIWSKPFDLTDLGLRTVGSPETSTRSGQNHAIAVVVELIDPSQLGHCCAIALAIQQVLTIAIAQSVAQGAAARRRHSRLCGNRRGGQPPGPPGLRLKFRLPT